MSVNFIEAVLTGVIVVVLTTLFAYLVKRFWIRPKLIIELQPPVIEIKKDLDVIDAGNDQYIKEVQGSWAITFSIYGTITNNSSIIAYSPEVYVNDEKNTSFSLEYSNTKSHIAPLGSIKLKAAYKELTKSIERPKVETYPDNLQNLKFLLKYKNENGTVFYTEFLFENGYNKYKRWFRPRNFRN